MKIKSLFTLFSLAIGAQLVSAQTIVTTNSTNKNIVLEELTGIHCGYCPDGHKKAQELSDNNPGRIIVLNIHTGSYASPSASEPDFRTTWGDYVGGLFAVSGYPTGAVNRRNFLGKVMNSRSAWAGHAFTVLSESSPVNVGANANLDIGGRIASVDVEAYYTAAGTGSTNKIHVVMLQDNIPGPQSGGSSWNPTQVLPNGDYNHTHMFRDNITPNAGDDITTIAATNLYINNYSHNIPNDYIGVAVNISDLHVAVFVAEGAANTSPIITGDYANLTFITPAGALDVATSNATYGSATDYCANGSSFTPSFSAANATVNTITSIKAQYTIDGGSPVYTTITGLNLAINATTMISFPSVALPAGVSNLKYKIDSINGTDRDYVSSNNIGLSGYVGSLTGSPTTNGLVEDFETPALGTTATFEYSQQLPGALFVNPYSLTYDVFGLIRYNGTNSYSLSQCIQAGFAAVDDDGVKAFPPNGKGEVIFDNINLTNREDASLTFDYANAPETVGYGDGFMTVYASQDCGVTWDSVWARSGWTQFGNQLATVGYAVPGSTGAFYPASASEWANVMIDLGAYDGASKLTIKFEMGYESSSNALYVDNVNITSVLPVNTIKNLTSLVLMPNPVQNAMTVEFSLEETEDLNIAIFNTLGQQVQHVASEKFVGASSITVNTSNLTSGVYFLNFMSAKGVKTERFVVEK
jgi:hypothetical protein